MITTTHSRLKVGHRNRYRTYLYVTVALVVLLSSAVVFRGLTNHAHGDDQPQQVRTAAELQALAEDRVVTIGAHRELIPDLQQLTQQADLIVVGQVTRQGKTRTLAPAVGQPADVPLAEQPADVPLAEQPADGATDGAMQDRPSGEMLTTVPGLPITEFPIRVTRVLKGSATPGKQVTVGQVGGQILLSTFPGGPQLKRTIRATDDPLMQSGQQYLLFLTQGEDGVYGVVGGAQGRFTIDQQGRLRPIGEGTQLGRDLAGKRVEQVATVVKANKP